MEKRFGRWYREKIVEELAEKFGKSSSLFVTEFTRLKVNDLEQLRKNLKKNSATFMVVKNSFARFALDRAKLGILNNLIEGQTGIVLGGDDPVAISKVLIDYHKTYPDFKIKGGFLDAQLIPQEKIKELSQLPPRPILVGKLCGSLKGILGRFVNSISIHAKLLYMLKAFSEKKKEG